MHFRVFSTSSVVASLAAACAALHPARSAELEGKALSSIQIEQQSSIVPKSEGSEIWEYYNLYPDCMPAGKMTVRIISPPAHGKIETIDGEGYPSYPAENVRSRCNAVKSPALKLKYTPTADFLGEDHVDIVIIYPGGSAGRSQFTIGVM